jgi:glycerol-3-phosphate dehydrogenase
MNHPLEPAFSLTNKIFDVVIVGAGINGLGIARDAAERGLSVCIVEQEDVCSGVSAWSGRLVHGGLRYLEHKDVALVRESLRERERLFRVAPHLVKPVRLIMPFYSRNKRPAWLIRLGMVAYDVLSADKAVAWHRILSKKAVLERFTGMSESDLSGAALFTDGRVEYAERLCVELAVAAAEAGAIILNHHKVVKILKTDANVVTGVVVKGRDDSFEINAEIVINAGGPWVDAVLRGNTSDATPEVVAKRLIGGSKGSHIIVDAFPGAPTDVVYYESQADGRLVLVIPWMGRYLIGCTDILFDEEPDSARAEDSEITYLLNEANVLMPQANLTLDKVLYTYSGVRPLPYAPGVPEWKIPRSHIVLDHAKSGYPGLLSIVGGKLTTYRQLAEDATDVVVKKLGRGARKPVSKNSPFPGARTTDFGAFVENFSHNDVLLPDTTARLIELYGVRAQNILDMVRELPELQERFDPASPAIAAELIFALETEFAATLTDLFARRTMLAFEPSHGLGGLARASEIVGLHQKWSAADQREQTDEYVRWLDHLRVPGRPELVAEGAGNPDIMSS